jgi:phage shock protein PspC (stress-responsive transcriptional regulator)
VEGSELGEIKRPLRRSRRRRLVAGVCGGIAEWLGWPPTLVRLVFIVGSLVPVVPGFLVYLALWLLVPLEKPAVLREN